jgi:hypothetical protein
VDVRGREVRLLINITRELLTETPIEGEDVVI